MTDKSPQAFRTISEVADELDLPQHVLRFWETKFSQIRPMKRSSGRRFYRPEDVELVRAIRDLLYGQGYTIRGVQKLLKEHGAREIAGGATAPPPPAPEEDRSPQERFPDDDEPAPVAAVAPPVTPDIVAALRSLRDEVRACVQILADARGDGGSHV